MRAVAVRGGTGPDRRLPSVTPLRNSVTSRTLDPQMVTPSTCNVCTAPAANGTATVFPLRYVSERAL